MGDHVRYCDERGTHHHALVQAVWPGEYGADNPPGLNLVIISDDPAETDNYGRQLKHRGSIVHKSIQPAPANYWY